VYQGERPVASQNKLLGRFQLTEIPPAPRLVPQIEVTFDIDANGIVNVSARDKATNREQRITISGTGSLSKDEIEKMVHDAEAHAAEDEKVKEKAELRNQGDALIYSTKRTLEQLGAAVSAEDRAAVESAQADLKSALDADDAERIKKSLEALQQATYKLSEAAYKQSAAAGAGTPESNGHQEAGPSEGAHTAANDDVIDAEFKSE
jgi:molecular chaperone DnaK